MLFILNSHKVNKLNSGLLSSQTATCIYRGAARPPTLARNRPEMCSSQIDYIMP
jgi:hypothetical protein